MKYEIEIYVHENGKQPFYEWVNKLKDSRVVAKIMVRLDRAARGNFGDSKPIQGAKGLFEMREHVGAGYRIYYSIVDNKVVLILSGSDKKDQKKAIQQASDFLEIYERSN